MSVFSPSPRAASTPPVACCGALAVRTCLAQSEGTPGNQRGALPDAYAFGLRFGDHALASFKPQSWTEPPTTSQSVGGSSASWIVSSPPAAGAYAPRGGLLGHPLSRRSLQARQNRPRPRTVGGSVFRRHLWDLTRVRSLTAIGVSVGRESHRPPSMIETPNNTTPSTPAITTTDPQLDHSDSCGTFHNHRFEPPTPSHVESDRGSSSRQPHVSPESDVPAARWPRRVAAVTPAATDLGNLRPRRTMIAGPDDFPVDLVLNGALQIL